jgi:hypothetical protein
VEKLPSRKTTNPLALQVEILTFRFTSGIIGLPKANNSSCFVGGIIAFWCSKWNCCLLESVELLAFGTFAHHRKNARIESLRKIFIDFHTIFSSSVMFIFLWLGKEATT